MGTFFPEKQPAIAGHVFEQENIHVAGYMELSNIDIKTQKLNVCVM